MSNLLNYLKQEGLFATAKKAWNKVFQKGISQTIFLRADLSGDTDDDYEVIIEKLEESNRAAFEEIKFWDFVNADDYIGNEHQSVIMLRDGENYIAYAAEEHATDRLIHGLGSFLLKSDEGWIGPVYVRKKWRGRGYSRRLLLQQMYRLKESGMTLVYTAINSQNTASLKSFSSVGFEEIGILDTKGSIIQDKHGILLRQYCHS